MKTRPGDWLRALAARVFDARTMERLIDPFVADLQAEHDAAVRAGRMWRSRWVRMAGYVVFLEIVAMCGWRGAMRARNDWAVDDRRAFVRVIGCSIVPVVAITLFLALPPLMQFMSPRSIEAQILLTLIPWRSPSLFL